jgi:hypothetical protein
LSGIRELDFGGVLEHSVELDLVLAEWSTEGPHESEDEEGFIDLLDFLVLSFFLESLDLVVIVLSASEISVERVNDAGESLDLAHVADWSNLLSVFVVFQEGV